MMKKRISSALISVFYKDGLEPILVLLSQLGIQIYSTGGTQKFIQEQRVASTPVEKLTGYPSILGGRVKTLHPIVFGGILGRRDNEQDRKEMKEYAIPEIDLVITDLYPFEETVKANAEHSAIIEKIDVGGPSMIRAAAKNYRDVVVIASRNNYNALKEILRNGGVTTEEERKMFAAKAFAVTAEYDAKIAEYYSGLLSDAQIS